MSYAQNVATKITPTSGTGDLGTTVADPVTIAINDANSNGRTYDIIGGTRPNNGSNLFHSFQNFNVGKNDTANFVNDSGLTTTNILSRVTGGDPSKIHGTIKTTGFKGAHLFFLNPSGVLFGPKARLAVEGSFHVSTADYVRLDDGRGIFYSNDTGQSVLTSAPPTAFGFLQDDPATIWVNKSVLEVQQNKTLSVVGGNICIAGGELHAPQGQLQIASADSLGEVALTETGLETDSKAQRGTLHVSNSSLLDVSGPDGGQVLIRASQFVLESQSKVHANTDGIQPGRSIDIEVDGLTIRDGAIISTSTRGEGNAGDLHVEAHVIGLSGPETGVISNAFEESTGNSGSVTVRAGSLDVLNGASINTDAERGSTGDAGSVTVIADRLQVRKGSNISASTRGEGNAGDLLVEADEVVLSGPETRVISNASEESAGNSGNVTVRAGSLDVMNGARISASSLGEGDGSNLLVEADTILLSGEQAAKFTGITTGTRDGDGGNLVVRANHLDVRNGARISASTRGKGNAGDLRIEADTILLSKDKTGDFTGISTGTQSNTGNAGDLTVSADRLEVRSGAGITAGTQFIGNGGDLLVEADTIILSGRSFINVDARRQTSTGRGGSLTVRANSLEVQNGAGITGNTFGSGDAGNLRVDAHKITLSEKGSITANAVEGSTGNAGDLTVVAYSLEVRNGARIIAGTAADGDGGNLFVRADTVSLSGGAPNDFTGISASTLGAGQGGDVTVQARDIRLQNGARIAAQSTATGRAGKLTIVAADSFRSTDSFVTTRATQADGGDIELKASEVVFLTNSAITTSVGAGEGDGGNITIDPVFVVLDSSRIQANAFGGEGGNIKIVADYFFASADSVVEASSALGIDGKVTIDSPNTNITGPLSPLSASYLDASTLLGAACAERSGARVSRLVVKPYDVLPDAPRALRVYLPELGSSASAATKQVGKKAANEAFASFGKKQLRFRCADTL